MYLNELKKESMMGDGSENSDKGIRGQIEDEGDT